MLAMFAGLVSHQSTSMFEATDPFKALSSRRWLSALVVVFVIFFFTITSRHATAFHALAQNFGAAKEIPSAKFDASLLLNGAANASFKDNLRPEIKYITSWPYEGLTNQMITYMNLIYLGLITERVPIIPRFTPRHLQSSSSELDFGEIFDIPRLQEAINLPILQWSQVKEPDSQYIDELGCWNVQNTMRHTSGLYHGPPNSLNIDVSYTTPPEWIQYPSELNDPQFPHALLWALASLAFNDTRTWSLQEPEPSPAHRVALPPDEHLLCYDMLYYTGAHQVFEYATDLSPVWRFVGQHLHWTSKLQQVAESYSRKTLGIAADAPIPPYISVHARRTDFEIWCNGVPTTDCYVELSAIARRVDEVKAELLTRKGIQVDRVIITSDEEDSGWWDEVRQLGWSRPDHSQTIERYGPWYPPLIDKAIQSASVGFVGTDRSTFSILSLRRVRSWHNGATRMVLWGRPGADDH
ncbi:hypothetical protein B0H11DRAFT_956715 [Mycena galericulata]|nr:hypothetical protein B0H11DRAFT_956715 [Mycena galericulata]